MALKRRPLTINGTAGDDVLFAPLDRAATIFGRGGNDTIRGSLQANSLDGGAGNDTIFYSANDGQVGISANDADTLLGGRVVPIRRSMCPP
jgi:Ca2+-binding RTX toxin-like protein